MTKMSEKEFAKLIKNRPDLATLSCVDDRPETEAANTWRAADRKKLEERFLAWWQAIGGPELEREFKFAPDRRFRADFVHLASKVIIEIDGGLWTNGSHNSQGSYHYQQERDRIARGLDYEVRRLGTGFELWQVEEVLDVVVERC